MWPGSQAHGPIPFPGRRGRGRKRGGRELHAAGVSSVRWGRNLGASNAGGGVWQVLRSSSRAGVVEYSLVSFLCTACAVECSTRERTRGAKALSARGG